MFDISKDELLRFSDVDLRELVARLCEAELKHAGAPVSAVRWGGAQTAPDGGLDVEIQVERQEFAGDFVPCAQTGFQVKKSNMPASKIAKEMSPDGVLRPIFSELARHNGCYIIASLGDDPTGPQLAERKRAMQAPIEAIKGQGGLRTEFYGRNDLANWLRQHPGVQLWVREKLGLQLDGWRPFGRWSTTPPGVEDGLICEPGVAIRLPGKEQDKLDIMQGIDDIRELVRNSGKAVRIVGLSGVGKSRIVQALFEESVGNEPLDRHLAIYADLGEVPDPSARTVLERLAADERSAIVILDNCPSDTHNRLAGQVASSPNLRLVTVEYDIREDKPEVTSVVRIDAEGPEITEILINRRHPDLGQVNARRIAEFSGGNARLALALADAVSEENESLSSFSNTQLFDRLFYQRGAPDTELLKAAEVLALVYSFSISPDEDGVNELATLAGLLERGQNRRTLYRAAQTLVDRQLAQKRGNWRAILPHTVADRLARRALENIPVDDILNAFQGLPSPRLMKSFGKRLGYLHDHETAYGIVKSWLLPGGLLHDLRLLNEEDIQLFLNVAPAAPEGVLSALEAQDEVFFSWENPRFSTFVDLLAKVAYDPNLFARCVNLLAKFALTKIEGENVDSIQNRLSGLFSLYLSGTEAAPNVRENLVRGFLLSDEPSEQQLGLGMLRATLRSHHWSSFGAFEFGARPRSYGYEPKTYGEQDQWFKRFIALAQTMATGDNAHLSTQVRNLLATELRSLWCYPGLRKTLADLARTLNDQRSWLEGWWAVRSIKHYDYRQANSKTRPDDAELLDELDEMLKPERLADEVRAYVLNPGHHKFALEQEIGLNDLQKRQELRRRAAARAYDLGTVVADEPEAIDELSQELFTAGHGYLVEFGRGMASTCSDLRALWGRLVGCLEFAGDQAQHCGVLCGFLEMTYERDESLAQKILDEAVKNRTLRKIIVALQLSVPPGSMGVNRLHQSLDFDDTPPWQFRFLACYRPLDTFSETDIHDLMLRVLDRPDGAGIVLEGLSMRLYALKDDELTLGSDLKRVGLCVSAALLRHDAKYADSGMTDCRLSEVLATCLDETEFPEETAGVINAYFARARASYGFVYGLDNSVAILAEKATSRFLDGVFFDPALEGHHRHGVFREQRDEKNPLSGVHAEALLAWCRQGDFQERLAMLSEAVYPFEKQSDGPGVVLSEQTHAIMEAAQEPSAILRNLCSSVCPSGWSGSRADIIAERRQAFETLLEHERSEIRIAARAQIAEIKRWETQERQREQAMDRRHEQRFE